MQCLSRQAALISAYTGQAELMVSLHPQGQHVTHLAECSFAGHVPCVPGEGRPQTDICREAVGDQESDVVRLIIHAV